MKSNRMLQFTSCETWFPTLNEDHAASAVLSDWLLKTDCSFLTILWASPTAVPPSWVTARLHNSVSLYMKTGKGER
jgi:hypothetical protein